MNKAHGLQNANALTSVNRYQNYRYDKTDPVLTSA